MFRAKLPATALKNLKELLYSINCADLDLTLGFGYYKSRWPPRPFLKPKNEYIATLKKHDNYTKSKYIFKRGFS